MSSTSSFRKTVANNNGKKSVEEKLTQFEAGLQDFAKQVGDHLQSMNTRLNTMEEIVTAIASVVGVDLVSQAIYDSKLKDLENAAESKKAALARGLEDGVIVASEEVTKKSIIVGVEKDNEGKVTPPGYLQLPLEGFRDELKPLLMGHKVGDSVVNPTNGHSVDITGVYLLNEPKQD